MSGGWGGVGAGVAAKVYVKAAAGLAQLAGGGYAFDGVSYDPDGIVEAYGADAAAIFDPLAIVFRDLPDGRYRLTGMLWPVGLANAWGGVIRAAGDGLTGAGDVDVTAAYAPGVHSTNGALNSGYGPSLFAWEGRVTRVDDGSLLGLYSALAIVGGDRIAQGSWLAIEQIG